MPNIKVENLPLEAMTTILEKTSLDSSACYRASFDLVVMRRIAKKYVLGFAVNSADGIGTSHAWIKLSGGQYADPLLQHLGLSTTTSYEMVHELTRDEVLDLLRKELGNDFDAAMEGKVGFLPPAIRSDGVIVFM